jgi:hypothetical protein
MVPGGTGQAIVIERTWPPVGKDVTAFCQAGPLGVDRYLFPHGGGNSAG